MKKEFLENENRRITIGDISKKSLKQFNNKTKALRVQFLRPSQSNKGYFKYEITYIEDGKIKFAPVYGVDMQDALKRFVLASKYDKLTKGLQKRKNIFTYGFLITVLLSTILTAIFLPVNKLWIAVIPLSIGGLMLGVLNSIETRIENSRNQR